MLISLPCAVPCLVLPWGGFLFSSVPANSVCVSISLSTPGVPQTMVRVLQPFIIVFLFYALRDASFWKGIEGVHAAEMVSLSTPLFISFLTYPWTTFLEACTYTLYAHTRRLDRFTSREFFFNLPWPPVGESQFGCCASHSRGGGQLIPRLYLWSRMALQRQSHSHASMPFFCSLYFAFFREQPSCSCSLVYIPSHQKSGCLTFLLLSFNCAFDTWCGLSYRVWDQTYVFSSIQWKAMPVFPSSIGSPYFVHFCSSLPVGWLIDSCCIHGG